ncbi:hypothetical protein SAMN05661008_00881 [Alkalithermobacter thermoalcaliphilus JW-YL-7 = DSM 7308]|uniref:Uncharacterized protein n=1 Tax=Alkalithermobacter thermoalcaliphilus JW-YL-7 = DSM 7308 TaxID=1121328 RepID=A0A150FQK4_CLOPD|nr:hypothetical protein JWYL7_0972 [[Clostridium] paradoxum JW-YL-7 = DSM 7308]SHK78237.1 hypothetical protein SAMN05661008_00881 [[Clostridium] paradoxum JW-YL-7 = DSM 7308]
MKSINLMYKIDKFVKEISIVRKINKINRLSIVVSDQSDIDKESLHKYLKQTNSNLIGEWTLIEVKKDKIPLESAIVTDIKCDYE